MLGWGGVVRHRLTDPSLSPFPKERLRGPHHLCDGPGPHRFCGRKDVRGVCAHTFHPVPRAQAPSPHTQREPRLRTGRPQSPLPSRSTALPARTLGKRFLGAVTQNPQALCEGRREYLLGNLPLPASRKAPCDEWPRGAGRRVRGHLAGRWPPALRVRSDPPSPGAQRGLLGPLTWGDKGSGRSPEGGSLWWR